MVGRATEAFMTLSWKSGAPKSVAGMALKVNENLDIIYGTKEIVSTDSRAETLGRCIVGSLIVVGKSPEDKEYINNILSKSYQCFNYGKKFNFCQYISQLLRKDSFFRNWVKRKALDTQSGFEWNRDVAKLLLGLKADRNILPSEFKGDLKIYPLEVVDEFVKRGNNYINSLPQTPKKRDKGRKGTTDNIDFMLQLQDLSADSNYFDDSPLSLEVPGKIADLIGKIKTMKS